MANIVSVSGMFGAAKTFFAGSPVVININGLAWPASSPFTVVRLDVLRDSDSSSSGEDAYEKVGEFIADTGGQTGISFDISSALQAIWAGYDFANEVEKARNACASVSASSSFTASRNERSYALCIHTEYIELGVLTRTTCQDSNGNTIIPGGGCVIGNVTEMERRSVTNVAYADVTSLHGSNLRHGYASTKPTSSLERVGSNSITSWVDASNDGTESVFYPANATVNANVQSNTNAHAPLVLRDSVAYTDFLFVNRRGAVETCSGQTLEALDVNVTTTTYSRVERPAFRPSRSLMATASGGRRSWPMSSGYQTREWAEWWAFEFLMARQWWMRINNIFLPVVVTPSQSSTGIYDRSKQQMPHVDFLVKLALEG